MIQSTSKKSETKQGRHVNFGAIQREKSVDVLSDGRLTTTVHNTGTVLETASPMLEADRSVSNISELSNTYKQFSGLLIRNQQAGKYSRGPGREIAKASLGQLKRHAVSQHVGSIPSDPR